MSIPCTHGSTKRCQSASTIQSFSGAPPIRPLAIGNGWMFEPTINFYRTTLGYDWLSPATRDRLHRDDNDVVYCFAADLREDGRRYRVLQAYPDTGTALYVGR